MSALPGSEQLIYRILEPELHDSISELNRLLDSCRWLPVSYRDELPSANLTRTGSWVAAKHAKLKLITSPLMGFACGNSYFVIDPPGSVENAFRLHQPDETAGAAKHEGTTARDHRPGCSSDQRFRAKQECS